LDVARADLGPYASFPSFEPLHFRRYADFRSRDELNFVTAGFALEMPTAGTAMLPSWSKIATLILF
jgi:hypothetical protein